MKKIFLLVFYTLISAFLLAQDSYTVINKFPVSGEGGWGYLAVDEQTGRIFISHGNEVNVINEKDGNPVGIIPDTKGVHGFALAPNREKIFISNGAESTN